jgi:hypothetical protein
MAHYRFYPLDVAGQFTAGLDLSCCDDGEARLLAAAQLLPGEWAELWQAKRCLGQVFSTALGVRPAQRPRAAPNDFSLAG